MAKQAVMIEREFINDALDCAGLEDEQLRESYSGRGMYGKICFGIAGDVGDLAKFLLALARNGQDELADSLAYSLNTDGMGLKSIFYFPGYQVEPEA